MTRPAPLKDRVGAAGEDAAASHLEAAGMTILVRDWRCRLGQIDAVALDGETLVVVEVKARRGAGFLLPIEAVDARKRRKLRMLAAAYTAAAGWSDRPVRIDVVGVLLDASLRVVRCDHVRDAVGD
ncbi:MAG TPA: YraN family protein [Candidatus Dormibacteraeota bacterium]|nr:YraN family protein [Candidatus Dormibacteraeota bacterium]